MKIIINCACSIDGRLTSTKDLSDKIDFERVYKMRTEVDAILVGAQTILDDDPTLTSKGFGKDPIPIILDRNNIIKKRMKIHGRNPIIFNENLSWNEIKSILKEKGIDSVMVEGGGKVIKALIESKAWDEFYIYYAPVFSGDNHTSLINGKLENSVNAKIDKVNKQGEGFLIKLIPV